MKKLNKKGFTIVELVIVIAVMAVLAAVLIPTFSNVISNSKDTKAVTEIKGIYDATLADDLADQNDENDVVYGKGTIYVINNNRLIEVKEGSASLIGRIEKDDVEAVSGETNKYKKGDITYTLTHTYNNGALAEI